MSVRIILLTYEQVGDLATVSALISRAIIPLTYEQAGDRATVSALISRAISVVVSSGNAIISSCVMTSPVCVWTGQTLLIE